MAKVDPRAERAAKFADVLRQSREQNTYPISASRLRELADPQLGDDDLFKTLTHDSLAVGARKDLAAPVVLAEDALTLAASAGLLEYALGKLASAEKPLHRLDRIVGKVDKPLQPHFQAALETRLTANDLPPSIGRQDVKGEAHLYLKQFPPPPPKRFPARELAEQLAAALEAKRQQGDTVVALSELAPDAEPGLLKKALAEEAFNASAVAVPVSKTLTLVAPSSEQQALLCSDRLLMALLEARTTAKKPTVSPADLAAALPEDRREAFLHSVNERIQSGSLPKGVITRSEEGQAGLCLQSNLPATLLIGEKLLAGLKRRRESGSDYPVRLNTLAHADAPGTPDDLLTQLANDKAFRSQVLFAAPGRADSPVALPGDEQQLAASRATLEFAVSLHSTPEAPLHPLKKLAGKLDATLRPGFEETVAKHVSERTLPATLTAHDVKGQIHLRRADYPLPPPADEALAGRLLSTLKDARREGIYPLSVRALLSKIQPEPSEKLTKTALAHDAFRTHAVVAVPGDPDAPAALGEDRVRLASEPRLLEYALSRVRSSDNQAITVPDVARVLTADLRPDFTSAVEKSLTSGELPPTVGCLVIKKKPHLFLKAELDVRPVIVAATRAPEPADMEEPQPETAPTDEPQEERGEPEPVEQGNLF